MLRAKNFDRNGRACVFCLFFFFLWTCALPSTTQSSLDLAIPTFRATDFVEVTGRMQSHWSQLSSLWLDDFSASFFFCTVQGFPTRDQGRGRDTVMPSGDGVWYVKSVSVFMRLVSPPPPPLSWSDFQTAAAVLGCRGGLRCSGGVAKWRSYCTHSPHAKSFVYVQMCTHFAHRSCCAAEEEAALLQLRVKEEKWLLSES